MLFDLPKKEASQRHTAPLSIRRNMIWNTIGSFLCMFAQWVTTVLVIRLSVGFDAAGVYTYVMSVYVMFSSIAEYRIYVYQVSDVRNEHTMGEYFSFRCITCALSIIITMLYAFATSTPDLWTPIFLYLLYKDAGLLMDIFHAEEQKAERMDYIGISLGLQGITSAVSFGIVFWLTQNLNLTILAMLVTTVLVGVFYDFPRARYFSDFKLHISRKKAIKLLLICASGVIALVAIQASSSIPRQYLLATMGEGALGAYGTIAAPLAIIQTGASYIYSPLLGYFTVEYENGNRRRFLRLLTIAVLGVIGVGVLAAILIALLGNFFYSLIYGQEVLTYMYLVPPLIVASLAMAFVAFFNTLLIALRNFKASFIGGIMALIACLATMIPATEAFQLNGPTVCLICASIVSTLVMVVFLFVQLREKDSA